VITKTYWMSTYMSSTWYMEECMNSYNMCYRMLPFLWVAMIYEPAETRELTFMFAQTHTSIHQK
jgi:hypothetical protein